MRKIIPIVLALVAIPSLAFAEVQCPPGESPRDGICRSRLWCPPGTTFVGGRSMAENRCVEVDCPHTIFITQCELQKLFRSFTPDPNSPAGIRDREHRQAIADYQAIQEIEETKRLRDLVNNYYMQHGR